MQARDEWEIVAILNGQKISRFFLNIIGKTEVVTIDRHAARIAGINKNFPKRMYKHIEAAYIEAGRELNIPPPHVQAVTWCAFRTANGINLKYGENI